MTTDTAPTDPATSTTATPTPDPVPVPDLSHITDLTTIHQTIFAAQQRMRELRAQQPPEDIRDYTLTRADGSPVRLSQLFGQHDDLLVVHNMGRGCAYCTLWADGFVSLLPHIQERTAFVISTPDSPQDQRAFAESRHWPFTLVSTQDSTFTQDMGYHNPTDGYWPGVSAFHRQPDGRIQRVSRDYFGPGDTYCSVWHLFDLLPGGPNGWEPHLP